MGLHILKGDAYINLACGDSSKPENLKIAKKAAEIILSKI